MQDGTVLLIELRLDENMVAIPLNRWQLMAHFSDCSGRCVVHVVVDDRATDHFEALRDVLDRYYLSTGSEVMVLHQLCDAVNKPLEAKLREHLEECQIQIALVMERINPGAPMPPWMG